MMTSTQIEAPTAPNEESSVMTIKQEPNNVNGQATLNRFVPINLPQNVVQNGPIFIPQNQPFVPTQLISGSNNNVQHQFVPISAPISNPTLPPPTNANAPPAALLAFQNQLMNINANKDVKVANAEEQKLPKQQQQPQQQQTVTYYNAPIGANSIYFPPQPKNAKDEILNENWSAKIAYAATLSSIINASATLYRERSEIALKPNWAELLYKLNGNADKDEKDKETESQAESYGMTGVKEGDNQQNVFDEAIEHIFKASEFFLCEISTKMAETKITEAIGMMKGLTDAVCNLITNASIHLPGSDTMKMRQLFENKLLVMWCSLLLRATTDVREAMQRYLTHEAFNAYYYYKTALKNEFYKHLSSDEKLLVSLRTKKEQYDFEENTKKYVEEANMSLLAARKITVLPHQDRINMMGLMDRKRRYNNIFGDGHLHGMGLHRKPAKKRRKKSRYQLFRVDGTPRKRQTNPSAKRLCKRMWQSDGVTKGCGNNSHPRGVCPCWKALHFTKADEKNGNILKWLEKKYGKEYKL